MSNKEIEQITKLLKCWRFKVIGSQSWMHSQVTAGGVSLRDICSNTLESKIVPNIYFAGELLDVDGDCGDLIYSGPGHQVTWLEFTLHFNNFL